MKIKYLRLSKKERKEARERYFATESGARNKKRINVSLICSILCMLFSVYLIIDAFIGKQNTVWDKIYGFSILIIGFGMFLFYFKLRTRLVNDYLTKKKK